MAFTHMDENGNAVMVDVSEKAVTQRTAVARGAVSMSPGCFAMVRDGRAKKGDVLAVAQVAGIMAAKRTAELIPLCHVLALNKTAVEFTLRRSAARSRRCAPSGATAGPGWRWRPSPGSAWRC